MLLGGSSQQVIAITTAKRLGYYTVLCDYLIDNPGQYEADRFYLVSTTDKDVVLQVAQQEQVDGVMAYASDPAAPTAAYVAEKIGCDVTIVEDDELENVPYLLSSFRFKVKLAFFRIFGKNISGKVFKNTKYIEDYLMVKKHHLPFIDDNTVVIYPEIVHGNPLHAKNVVRWLLYYNRYPNDPYAYGKKDLFICFRLQFNDEKLNPNKYQLHISHYDLDLYKRTNYGERHGKCYCIRKGANRADLPKNFDGPIIDALSEEEKVKLFNQCEYFVSYDLQTTYSSIAAMCGCISVRIVEPGKTKEDYRKPDDGASYGVAYSFDEKEIQWAKESSCFVRPYFEEANSKGGGRK